ncbi:Flavin monooxygenase-like [Parasponia andersonii]|uniref:Flavin monooxygenase-like n=1 Tax=Parasponia andersonii TaxID=3476 RepID=A0A2P5BYJ4_PARAD|nr:Flavin monooxygenase-like [Parasponia andersonii]
MFICMNLWLTMKVILTFICFQLATFPTFEFQSKWIAGVLSNRITLPKVEEMMEDVKTFYSELEISGVPKRSTQNLGDSQVLVYFSNGREAGNFSETITSFFSLSFFKLSFWLLLGSE